MPSRVLVLHGPNLNLLLDLPALDEDLQERAERLSLDLHPFQSNSEGAMVDAVHAERTRVSAIIVNAAKLSPTAEVLAEALELVKRPVVEVLLDPAQKARSALKHVALKQVTGKDAYPTALEAIAAELRANSGRPTGTMLPMIEPVADPQSTLSGEENTGRIDANAVKKTLGRRSGAERAGGGKVAKSMGRGDGTAKMAAETLSRAAVKAKISERLSGKLSPAGLATWARAQWQQIQNGAAVESGQRDKLEDVLQTLVVSASSKANDHQLIELMTQL